MKARLEKRRMILALLFGMAWAAPTACLAGSNDALIGHWKLAGDCRDSSSQGNHGTGRNVTFGEGPDGSARGAALFNGRDSLIEVPDAEPLRLGKSDFSLAVWIHTDGKSGDVVGDIVSKFDPGRRKGFQLEVLTNSGMTSTAESNYRNLQFGVDDGRIDPTWTDCGRPGRAVKIAALRVAGGALYAGTIEKGADEKGHLWRYAGGRQWTDLGNPVGCNAIEAIAECDGALYCGVGRYDMSGSQLGATLNTTPGGQVFRVEPDGKWVSCGHPGAEGATPEETPDMAKPSGKADDAIALTVFGGHLYCVSNHRRGVFRYEGGQNWKHVGLDQRVLTLTVYHGQLYALINGGPVYRYEGDSNWRLCGWPETSRQTYSAVTHAGRLYVGTWPEGEVYRYEDAQTWAKVGRVAYEREIMGMALYNGKVYLGGLPMANVYRMDDSRFNFVGNLDASPVILRRVWTLAVYDGKLFAGTLPSGRVWSIQAGRLATWDRVLPAGWHHVAAVREAGSLRLYFDGNHVATSAEFKPSDYNLDNAQPLLIGFGQHDYFNGKMRDLRVYRRALGKDDIRELSKQ